MAARRAASAAQKGKGDTKGASATKRRSAAEKPLGRPSEFTAEVERAILDALRAGASVTSACEAAGVGRTTYYRWLGQGEHEDGLEHFRDFRDATTRARASSPRLRGRHPARGQRGRLEGGGLGARAPRT